VVNTRSLSMPFGCAVELSKKVTRFDSKTRKKREDKVAISGYRMVVLYKSIICFLYCSPGTSLSLSSSISILAVAP